MNRLAKILISVIFVLILAIFAAASIPNPGHAANQTGGNTDAERTFYGLSSDKFFFPGPLVILGDLLNVTNNLTVYGSAIIIGNLNVTGSTYFGTQSFTNIDASGNLEVGNSVLFVNSTSSRVGIGTTNPNQALTVVGNVNVTGTINSAGTSTAGDLTVLGNLNVTGTSYFGTQSFTNIDTTGSLTVGSNANINGNTTIQGNLNVTGSTYLGNQVFVNIDASGNIGVGGNVTATKFIGDGSQLTGITSSYSGLFIDYTPVTTTGNITNGSLKGYNAANAICSAYYPNSHMCSITEILDSINNNISNANFTATFRITQGAPGYLVSANDCEGLTTASSASLGGIWVGSTSHANTYGAGGLVGCNAVRAIGCCG